MDGVVVEQTKAEHVRGDCVDAAVLEIQLGFVNICFILTPVFVPCFFFLFFLFVATPRGRKSMHLLGL